MNDNSLHIKVISIRKALENNDYDTARKICFEGLNILQFIKEKRLFYLDDTKTIHQFENQLNDILCYYAKNDLVIFDTFIKDIHLVIFDINRFIDTNIVVLHLLRLYKENDKLKDIIKKLDERILSLELAKEYAPGSSKYIVAKEHFEKNKQ